MIFNAFFKDFPLDCQKYMYHQKRKKSLISIIIQFHFTMPHSLYGLRLYKISNEIYFSIMTL